MRRRGRNCGTIGNGDGSGWTKRGKRYWKRGGEACEKVYKAQEETANIIRTAYETNKRVMIEANENAQEIIKAWSAKREELAEQRKARAEVIRQKGRILKKLNSPKPGSFVPYQMREAVTALLKALDYTGRKRVYH